MATTPAAKPAARRRRSGGPGNSLYAQGEPLVWLTGGALALCLTMIVVMLIYIVAKGAVTFWPGALVRIETKQGEAYLGEITRSELFRPVDSAYAGLSAADAAAARAAVEANGGVASRSLVLIGNRETGSTNFRWIIDFHIAQQTEPQWALGFERLEWGRAHGEPIAMLVDGQPVAEGREAAWAEFRKRHPEVLRRVDERRHLEVRGIGDAARLENNARLEVVQQRLRHERGDITADQLAEAEARFIADQQAARAMDAVAREKIAALNAENHKHAIRLRLANGTESTVHLAEVVRAYNTNQLGVVGKLGLYTARWWEFLTGAPRAANSEGGVFPAIVGTVLMTLVMTLVVVPFGVLAALYLREYAKAGPVISAVRIAINNLAGVPSIVFGVFGLGFFIYVVGDGLDNFFYEANLPSPTFGKGGVLWASLTLALLTLPVVIVATEEALAAVPGSMRQGSYACGASKWQTIRRIVLPRAMPGIMTGMILAMARGAGEVAPLMLVGAVKLAPDLPIDFGNWSGSLGFLPTGPIHLDRSFMHLGFHIYDVGFQSQDSEASRPMVFTTTLLLIVLVVTLNITAMWLRTRLRRRFGGSQF